VKGCQVVKEGTGMRIVMRKTVADSEGTIIYLTRHFPALKVLPVMFARYVQKKTS
jgi:hypothetical protein